MSLWKAISSTSARGGISVPSVEAIAEFQRLRQYIWTPGTICPEKGPSTVPATTLSPAPTVERTWNLGNIYLIGLFSTNAQQPIAAHTDDEHIRHLWRQPLEQLQSALHVYPEDAPTF